MASAITTPEPDIDPRPVNDNDDTSNADSTAYVTTESLVALEAFDPGLLANQCASDQHVSMYKDEQRKEVWLLSKGDTMVP